jgi:hypothetical protein
LLGADFVVTLVAADFGVVRNESVELIVAVTDPVLLISVFTTGY